MFTKSFVAKWMVAVFMLSLLISCGGGTSTTTTGGNNPNPQPSDTTPPTVNSVTPVDTTTDIAVNTAISAVFSEAMKQTTITNATFTVTPPVTGTVIYSGTTATFAPYSNLSSSTTYTVTITRDAKDLAGNSLASNYVWTFKTAGSTPNSHPPVPNPIILPPSACPLGGGVGYANIVSPTNATFSVNNKADLLSALSSAKSGEIIYVNDDAEIDLTDQANLIIPAGVTLASGRGNGSSQGALLFSNRLTYTGGTEQLWKLFKSGGSGVRVTGIRLVGNDNETRGNAYEYSTSMGIYSEHNVEVDNSELSGWSDCAVCLYYTPASVTPQIHNNFIHHNRREGLGYGVVHAYAGNSIIEGNIFDWNRHSIAGDGRVNTSYTARYNLVLGNGNSHSFDMHGGADRGDGTDVAGKTINIYGNTFSTIRGIDTTWNEYAVVIRGIPTDGAYIHDNYFSNNNQTDAILQKNAFENMNINNNIFSGTYPTPAPYPFCSTPTP